ncbi:sulfurtransferase-like selenium metabolism protein YedF [Acidaminobacter hydrogenoformans]|uniref:sulfurtransferase-like selenium metabolism protein YedF n=1 Tax=Acidaminobacter hydrogenoformans TaxID=65403 RepID=UPI000B816C82|nr:sulfurtransferase-like selenium metabolism protein YedF [Acidaminobacter hydrogenoformans]
MNQKTEVDARGLTCPKPVIQTKKAMDQLTSGIVTTIVDNDTARENVIKYAKSQNFRYEVKQADGFYYIDIYKTEVMFDAEIMPQPKPKLSEIVILVGKNTFGEGDETLGEVLIKGYFYTLTELEPYPKSILFVNSGVQLTVEGSPVLEHLRLLESTGVEILSCGTCLDYYKIKEKLAVGGVGNMYAIVETMHKAKNTIRI